jgi:hypothetical protein
MPSDMSKDFCAILDGQTLEDQSVLLVKTYQGTIRLPSFSMGFRLRKPIVYKQFAREEIHWKSYCGMRTLLINNRFLAVILVMICQSGKERW